MNLTFDHIDDVKAINLVSASSTYGIGFFTAISYGLCNFFGLECKMYDKKIEKAKASAVDKLMDMAKFSGATGVMDIKIQIHATTVFMYGVAYKNN